MSMSEQNYISRQITVYKTDKKLIEFIDKLKPAPTDFYAHIHSFGDKDEEGVKQTWLRARLPLVKSLWFQLLGMKRILPFVTLRPICVRLRLPRRLSFVCRMRRGSWLGFRCCGTAFFNLCNAAWNRSTQDAGHRHTRTGDRTGFRLCAAAATGDPAGAVQPGDGPDRRPRHRQNNNGQCDSRPV